MRIQREMFRRLPIASKLRIIVGIFVAIVICVFFLGVLRSEILAGVRARRDLTLRRHDRDSLRGGV